MTLKDQCVKILRVASNDKESLAGRAIPREVIKAYNQNKDGLLEEMLRAARHIHPQAYIAVSLPHPKCFITIEYHYKTGRYIFIGFGQDGKFITQNEPGPR